jgi:hypothetical protein
LRLSVRLEQSSARLCLYGYGATTIRLGDRLSRLMDEGMLPQSDPARMFNRRASLL